MFTITRYEHVGIRVCDRDAALAFYQKLGFREAADFPEHHAMELRNPAGVYLNLIYNGVRPPDGRNVLMDVATKYPGVTHPAFVVTDFDALLDLLRHENIPITEGPIDIGGRRRACFIRDPDGTVLEFDEIYQTA